MGWYVTCRICGKEGKYGTDCDCYHKETMKNIARMSGALVEKAVSFANMCGCYLLTKCHKDNETFYLCHCMGGCSGEHACQQKIREISAEDFNRLIEAIENKDEYIFL
jgi:hypothetical protein